MNPSRPSWLRWLIPLAFLGGCTASVRPLWLAVERLETRPVAETRIAEFPVLVRQPDGRHAVAALARPPPGAVVVGTITEDDLPAINRDLREGVPEPVHERYCEIVGHSAGAVRIRLEVPGLEDSRRVGWYRLEQGRAVPERILSYGPGLALVVLPLAVAVGAACALLARFLVRRRSTS